MPSKKSTHDKKHEEKPVADVVEETLQEEAGDSSAELTQAKQKVTEYWDKLLRLQAEMDNVERRKALEVENAHKYALKKFTGELLPIIDSLELSVLNVPENLDPAANSVVEGAKLTIKMFQSVMEKFGIKQINPVGEAFEPEHQQAISMQVDPTAKPGTVLSVLQKGYTLNNRLIRPALVVVSKAQE